MTREEAVKELSALITRVPDFAVPLDMAITALQTDGDCISRQTPSESQAVTVILQT